MATKDRIEHKSDRQKKTPEKFRGFKKSLATTYFSTAGAVSLAQAGLTSLFGMGRGGPCRNSHPKVFKINAYR